MRLYRLIGLEIQALEKEHEKTLKNIAEYEDILNNYDSMAGVIIRDLDAIKKEYGKKRRTAIENAEEAVYEEKKTEWIAGYVKTIDKTTYERNKEAFTVGIPPCISGDEHRPDLCIHRYGQNACGKGYGYPSGKIPG